MKTADILVVVLAGGEGKRFYPLMTDKTLFPFMGKPLIWWVLEQVRQAGFGQVLVATNDKNHDYINTLDIGLDIRAKRQSKPMGQADAILEVLEGELDQPILMMNGVDMVEASLLQKLVEIDDKDAVLTGKRMKEYFPGGYLKINEDRVVGIVEKPQPDERPSEMVNLVEHYFASSKTLLAYLNNVRSNNDDVYEVALDAMMREQKVGFVEYVGFWKKLKYPHMVLDMMSLLMDELMERKISDTTEISEKAEIVGKVRIEKGATIMAGASVVGPAYIGEHVVVGQNSLVRESMVEAGAVIGFGSEVSRSYVGAGCMLHHNFVGDSILESEVNPSWGTTFANWRLFDDNSVRLKLPESTVETDREKLGAIVAHGVKMGVNCSVMPGVTISAGSKIYPGSVVMEEVEGDFGFER